MAWENFERSEFQCSHCGKNEIKDELVDVLQEIRSSAGIPMRVTSGYRCPDHPIEAAKAKPGSHTLGLAADIGVSHRAAFRILKAAMAHPKITAVGINQKGPQETRFLHLGIDDEGPGKPRPHVYSYP